MTRPSAWDMAKRRHGRDAGLVEALHRIADTVDVSIADPIYVQLVLRRAATRLEALGLADLARAKREGRGP